MIPEKSEIKYISAIDLKQFITEQGGVLLDVRLPDAFAEKHITTAINHCIYEVVFLDAVGKTVPEISTPIVVYGESADFKAAEVAYGRLKDAGYVNVSVLSDGLKDWQSEGGNVQIADMVEQNLVVSGRHEMDPEKSVLRWIGRNPTNQHEGKIAIQSGFIVVNESGDPLEGEIVIDMTQITCDDIADPSMNKVLIAHLSNDDFFKVDTFPQASFKITNATPLDGSTPGQPNFNIAGSMTLRGVTNTVAFPAMVNVLPDGLSFQAQFNVNRVDFGAVYGSGSLFERLGMHLVNDLVNIQITAIFR